MYQDTFSSSFWVYLKGTFYKLCYKQSNSIGLKSYITDKCVTPIPN